MPVVRARLRWKWGMVHGMIAVSIAYVGKVERNGREEIRGN